MSDVIIAGGGVIGLSIAYELAGQGMSVSVFDRGSLGQEASWAGAGMLPPGNPEFARTPTARLRAASCRLWPEWSTQLYDATAVDNGFRKCGSLEISDPENAAHLQDRTAELRTEGVLVEDIAPGNLGEYEAALKTTISAAYRLPDMCQVRNPRHLKALMAACGQRGVAFRPGVPILDFEIRDGRVTSVWTDEGKPTADIVVVTAGPWTRQLLERCGLILPIVPVRGQIVLLSMPAPPFRHIIEVGTRYLVPRPDGRILVGATEEDAGFDKRTTAAAVGELLRFATNLVPSLADARVEQCWAGLRPKAIDGLPYLGQVPDITNLYVAGGHFRDGLQQSPATAVAMRQLILGQPTLIPMDAYACDRPTSEFCRVD